MCGRQLNQQAIAQTALKLHVVYNGQHKKFYACDMKGESFRESWDFAMQI